MININRNDAAAMSTKVITRQRSKMTPKLRRPTHMEARILEKLFELENLAKADASNNLNEVCKLLQDWFRECRNIQEVR